MPRPKFPSIVARIAAVAGIATDVHAAVQRVLTVVIFGVVADVAAAVARASAIAASAFADAFAASVAAARTGLVATASAAVARASLIAATAAAARTGLVAAATAAVAGNTRCHNRCLNRSRRTGRNRTLSNSNCSHSRTVTDRSIPF